MAATAAADESFYHAQCQYYCREHYFHAMQLTASEAMKKFGQGPAFRFWFSLSLALEGKLQEALRELENTMNDGDLQLASVLASMYCHQLCQSVDREAVQALDGKRREGRKKAGDRALYFAGMFLVLTDHPDKAREYLDRSLKQNADSVDSWVMRGWVEMYVGENPTKAIEYLEQAEKRNARDIALLFCRARYYELHNDFSSAQTELNQVVAMRPGFAPPLVEKMKISMAMLDWDQCSEMINRILATAPHSLEALRHRLVGLLTRDGDYAEAAKKLEEFVRNVERHEPHNPPFLLECARLFSRSCGRNAGVLDFTLSLAEKAAELEPTRAEFMVEVGYQYLMKDSIKEALKYYKMATKLDESSMEALSGIITCQLIDGDHQTAEQSLEFLKETQRSLGYTSDILYLSALLARRQNKSPDEVLGILKDAIETHFRSFRTLPLSVPYLIALNPDFLIMLVKDCLHYAPTQVRLLSRLQPVAMGSAVPSSLKLAMTVLEPVTKSCPGLIESLYLMAKAKYLSGDDKMAASSLKHCIEVDQSYADAHILNAQIQLHQGFFKQASQSLELGLSYNFEIKDHPLFHLIKARIQKREDQLQEAIQTLHTAIQLAGLTSRLVKGSTPKSKIEVNANDQVSIYLELADAYRMADQEADAKTVMEEATLMFKGTGEEVRILVANADLLLARNEVSAALTSLRNITPEQPYYLQSRQKMAEIYFDYLKDRRMYAAMFKEIVDQIPTPASYLMLGDAYMTILEPDKAIEVYESALKRNPRDHDLALKMGRALVKTHNYGKAINYYKEAIKVGEDDNLRFDMAELQMRMRQYDKAEKTVQQALEKIKTDNANSLAAMIMQAQLLKLLAKVYDLMGDINNAINTLQEANELQVRVLKRVQMEQPDSVAEHRARATEICCSLSERYQSQRNYESAIKYYREALQHSPDDAPALLALARLYMQTGDLDQCQYTCMTLLRQDKENDLATVMMADLSFRRNDYETAMFHFQELLTRRPDYFAALARLIEVMRRTGHLEKVPDYLEKAEKACTRGPGEPGLAFCNALNEWYSSNPNGALKYFNQARRDAEWGQRAIYHMINICLNPDNMTIGGETFEAMDDLADQDVKDSQEMALRTAEKLLQELKPKPGDQAISHQLLTNYLLMASKNKGNIERALQEFTAIAGSDMYKDHVGAICGMSTAYMLLKQTPRARNQLKRVAKNVWNFEDAEYLERCWLLLADIYIQSGKYDLAQDVIQRTLQYNRSCGKAHEYAGFIHEKESSYKDAAENYEMSWRFSRHSNPVIGFKLAFNYLKAKRFVDAIDVCHQVLEKFPDYPKIRKEILDKARAQLKI